jgi:ribonuclease HI
MPAMSDPIRIWLEISHHAAFRVGGWAYVRADGASVMGHAGGDRRIEAERAALSGLIAALREPRGSRDAELRTSSDLIAAIPVRLEAAKAGETPPEENLDLWAQVATTLAAAPVRFMRETRVPGSPPAFAAAWAELARDRAKDKGAFAAPIPKSNLAKAGVTG